jgi:2-polyprenyl-6-methoxyphenol hydroxylase-like FAD-dependent oxidoreductase
VRGPAGAATAIRAALSGLDVVVVEPRQAPVDKACGEGIAHSAVDYLARLGVEPAGRPFHGIRYLDSSHRARRGSGPARVSAYGGPSCSGRCTQRLVELGVPVLTRRWSRSARTTAR